MDREKDYGERGGEVRSRNLKPGFFKNDSLGGLPPLARLLYAGLWCLADREGRLYDRPKRIKAEILPYDNANIDSLLVRLQQAGLIRRYSNEQDEYIDIPKFKCHQNPHPHEKSSIIPAYSEVVTSNDMSLTCPADIRNPDILIPVITSPRQVTATKDLFDEWYVCYPRKQAKADARKAWDVVTKKVDAQVVIDGLKKQLPWLTKKERTYIPMPATWLRQGRWEDEPDVPVPPAHVPFDESKYDTTGAVPMPEELRGLMRRMGNGFDVKEET